MGAGKVLILIGGIITLASTFFLAFFAVLGSIYGFGLGFIFNIPDIFSNADGYALVMDTEVMIVYILTIVYIVFAISGILQLIGLASRPVAIIGSILPIVMGILILLITFGILDDFSSYTFLFWHDSVVDNILPFHLAIGDASLGTYTLLVGGVLGLIGGIIGSDEW